MKSAVENPKSESAAAGDDSATTPPAARSQVCPAALEHFSLPPPWPEDLRTRIREWIAARPGHKLVVLDDDPTGTQTVHDVPVLTVWDVETLRAEFARPGPCFYILTNSRSLAPDAAAALNLKIARNLRVAAAYPPPAATSEQAGNSKAVAPFTLVSSSDPTLRGHFPLETDVLARELGPFDATLLIPCFEAGARLAIGMCITCWRKAGSCSPRKPHSRASRSSATATPIFVSGSRKRPTAGCRRRRWFPCRWTYCGEGARML